ncbi:DUF397 domain-containing protein [Streptomyces sp. NPDC096132]|uniref:DUF397 domain-containing protein n=1 Tax=Streptomyces sp. NPDC096132 TaxID=3366075 RepID=UPI003828F2F0
MSTLHWQKSSYSGDGSNCLNIAADAVGTIHLRESDEPDAILTTTTPSLRALICSLKDTPEQLRTHA